MKKQSVEQNLSNLAAGVLAAARVRYPQQPLRVWFAKLGCHSFKAYLIDTTTKQIVLSASSADSEFTALGALRLRVSPSISKART